MISRAARGAGAVALGVVLAGCSLPRFGQPDPATKEGGHGLALWQGFFLTACAVGALVLGLILYAAIRFRRRSDDIPNQRHFNTRWEIAYTVTPIAIVAVLFGFSLVTQGRLDPSVDHPDLVVNVTAFQWGWQFEYPDRQIKISGSAEVDEKPTLVLPEGRTTRLVMRTTDVVHSFWVPSFLNKRDMIPGVDNSLDVTPTQIGTFDGRCAEYCALDHWRMGFTLKVVPVGELDRAIADASQATSGGPP